MPRKPRDPSIPKKKPGPKPKYIQIPVDDPILLEKYRTNEPITPNFQNMIEACITIDDVKKVIETLKKKANEGEKWAVELFLKYTVLTKREEIDLNKETGEFKVIINHVNKPIPEENRRYFDAEFRILDEGNQHMS